MEFQQALAKEEAFCALPTTSIHSQFCFTENTISGVVYLDMLEQ
jgi:hypothetical protein